MPRKSRFVMSQGVERIDQLTPTELSRQEFGRRLYGLLIAKKLNQSQLATMADVGRDSISRYIAGKTFPTPLLLAKMAEALGVEESELLPNSLKYAMEEEQPAIDLRQAAGHPGMAWLRINRAMTFGTASKIIALIDEEDGRAE